MCGGTAMAAPAAPVARNKRSAHATGCPLGVTAPLTSAVRPGTPCIVDSQDSLGSAAFRQQSWYGKITFAIRITRVAVPIAHLGGGGLYAR
ncbi:putative Fis family transcriptional regulator [Streptomyces lydicamycinicus]|uniref:Putative Fis family transcriptional regulator n=1 Tax=Streptomyces lydicamycinicus TaxID=1546107 RepID=A0A0P4RAF2_9ACTN|nr:putative Fis family transcriptional regulator [Streptomyces lydicamycinicus]